MWIGLSTPAKIVTLASQRTCKNSTFNHSLEWKIIRKIIILLTNYLIPNAADFNEKWKKFRLILFLSNIENPLYRTMQLQWPSFLVHENNLIQLIKSPKSLYMRLFLNPLPPDISVHILHTIHYTFPKVLTRRICLIITSCFSWWSFPLFSWPWHLIQGWFC